MLLIFIERIEIFFPKNLFPWVNILLDIYFVASPVIKMVWGKSKEKTIPFCFVCSSASYKLVKSGFILLDGGKVKWRQLWQINRDSKNSPHSFFSHMLQCDSLSLKTGFYWQDCLLFLGPIIASLTTSEFWHGIEKRIYMLCPKATD